MRNLKRYTQELLLVLYRWHVSGRLTLRTVTASVCQVLFEFCNFMYRRSDRSLLVAFKNDLTFQYALEFIEFARKDFPSIVIHGPKKYSYLLEAEARLRGFSHVPFVSLWQTLTRRWSLAVTFSHGIGSYIHPSIPRLWLGHGIETGKTMFGGHSYSHSWKAMASFKRCAYSVMAIHSPLELELPKGEPFSDGIKQTMEMLTEPVAVKLLAKDKNKLRKLAPLKKVVVCSTWGSNSNAKQNETTVTSLIEVLKSHGYTVSLCLHPKIFKKKCSQHILDMAQRFGCKIVGPSPREWIPTLQESDIMIGDLSAMSLYFSLLDKPVIFFPTTVSQVRNEKKPIFQLMSLCPTLDVNADIPAQLEDAFLKGRVERREFLKTHYPRIDDGTKLRSLIQNLIHSA